MKASLKSQIKKYKVHQYFYNKNVTPWINSSTVFQITKTSKIRLAEEIFTLFQPKFYGDYFKVDKDTATLYDRSNTPLTNIVLVQI